MPSRFSEAAHSRVVELAVIRLQVESIDTMEQIDDETRALIIRHWPDIADKLPTK